jgi:hypothetical protein
MTRRAPQIDIRKALSVIAGMVAGFIVVSIVEAFSSQVFPVPDGLDIKDRADLAWYVSTLPATAFLFVLGAHILGAFVAGFTCVAVSRTGWMMGALFCGGVILAGGIANLFIIPHPTWFRIVDVLVYLPSAWFGGLLALRFFGSAATKTETKPQED